MMRYIAKLFIPIILFGSMFIYGMPGYSQSTEDKFKDLFVTAGYATAFGAALGAATLSFNGNPENHLKFVAIGASLGFIGGSILGSYVAFSPMFTWNDSNQGSSSASNHIELTKIKPSALMIVPNINLKNQTLSNIQGAWTIAQF